MSENPNHLNSNLALPSTAPLSRIYIQSSGDIVVTDLWEEMMEILEEGDFDAKD